MINDRSAPNLTPLIISSPLAGIFFAAFLAWNDNLYQAAFVSFVLIVLLPGAAVWGSLRDARKRGVDNPGQSLISNLAEHLLHSVLYVFVRALSSKWIWLSFAVICGIAYAAFVTVAEVDVLAPTTSTIEGGNFPTLSEGAE